VNTYDKKYPTKCPACPEEIETQDHKLTCPCPKCQEWRDRLLKAISDVQEAYQLPQDVTQLMLEGIRYSIGQQNTVNQNPSPTVAAIASAQHAIGWTQLMKGRMANEWKQVQHESMLARETKYKNAHTWSTAIIQTILEK
jgi:hypothetical protein